VSTTAKADPRIKGRKKWNENSRGRGKKAKGKRKKESLPVPWGGRKQQEKTKTENSDGDKVSKGRGRRKRGRKRGSKLSDKKEGPVEHVGRTSHGGNYEKRGGEGRLREKFYRKKKGEVGRTSRLF